MYKKHIIKDVNNNLSLAITKGFTPFGSVGLLPEGERIDWMEIGDIVDPETSEVTQGPIVNETTKAAVLAQDAADQAVKDKADQVTARYNEMTQAVYDEMENIFYTKKSDSATANYEMWKHMKDNAALYSGKGLKAEYQLNNADATELYSPGSALDTDAKIVAYATRKLEQADEYIVWRSDRIQQFRNERDIINA